jgi:ribosome-binding ATPase
MAIKAGLVGLPNVGKSTLFNALTQSSIPAENYPFCTVDPHIAITHVPDERTNILRSIYESKTIVSATVTFVDIAGLVKGAASGEGLGNQFLSHIRETDLIIHVLRCFEDPGIIRTGDVDPISDYEIIMIELALKDIESIEKRLEKAIKLAKTEQSAIEKGNLVKEIEFLQTAKTLLENHDFAVVRKKYQEHPAITAIPLLVVKECIVVANVSENDMQHEAFKKNPHVQALLDRFGTDKVIPTCIRLEYELSQLSEDERELIKQDLGITDTSMNEIIKKTYQNLNLITFFTCGPQEIHSWPILKGITVKKAAGEIHSDLEKGFICAEVLSYHDLLEYKTTQGAKQAGKVRIEGASYIVQDGDIILVRFSK